MVESFVGRRVSLTTDKLLFEGTFASAKPWQNVEGLIEFPDKVCGLKILDVGAGGSDMIAHLLERGAEAYAIDPLYTSWSRVKGEVRKTLAKLEKRRAGDQKWEEFIRCQHEALERFVESAKCNPDHYKPAFASELPFPDNYFDLVFSINCVCQYLDINFGTLLAAVNECLRVLKPGGTVQLFPFRDVFLPPGQRNNSDEDYEKRYWARRRNQGFLLEALEQNPSLSFVVLPASGANHKNLAISKI